MMGARQIGSGMLAGAIALTMAGCGLDAPGSSDPTDPPVQPKTPSNAPAQPTTAQQLEVVRRDVAAAYQSLTTLTADYDNHQSKGSERYFAKVHMRFSKPRKLRLEIESCSDTLLSGASVLWLGGNTIKGKKTIGVVPIVQEHTLQEKACLRGWLYNQTDYDAMVQALLAGLPTARVLGTSNIGGTAALLVEFHSSLPGVQVERIGIDPMRRLPVYRELRETAQGSPVFTTLYTHLVPNATLPKDSFSL